jgi:phosphocarrier protein HPr
MNEFSKEEFKKECVIKNKLGLHARPAALFVQMANRFSCQIRVTKGNETVSGKSIMGIMTLAVQQGTRILIEAEGQDSQLAIESLENLINNNFGEE